MKYHQSASEFNKKKFDTTWKVIYHNINKKGSHLIFVTGKILDQQSYVTIDW